MYDKGSEKPIGFMGSESDKRNQQHIFLEWCNCAGEKKNKKTYIYIKKIENYISLLRLWNDTNYCNLLDTGTQHHDMLHEVWNTMIWQYTQVI